MVMMKAMDSVELFGVRMRMKKLLFIALILIAPDPTVVPIFARLVMMAGMTRLQNSNNNFLLNNMLLKTPGTLFFPY